MSDWKPGWVETMGSGPVRIAVGQLWGYFPDKTAFGDVLALRVVAVSPEGEVSFKAVNQKDLERMYPVEVAFFKGKPSMIRGNKCPFDWTKNKERFAPDKAAVDKVAAEKAAEEARLLAEKKAIQEGYLLVHEGWSVWNFMHLRTGPAEGV